MNTWLSQLPDLERQTDPDSETKLGADPVRADVARPARDGERTRRILVGVRWPLGGIRTHILYNYPTAARRGYRFTFVGPADSSLQTLAESLRGVEGCEFVGVGVTGKRCRLWASVRRLIRSGRFALLHSHGLTAAVHGVLANLGLGLPHLATVHDPLRPEQFPGLRGRLKRWVLGRAVNCLDTIIFPGEDVRANFMDFLPTRGRSRCRLVTVPNGINAAHYATRPPGTDLRRRLALRPGTCLMGFLGRFMEQKGFLPLLDALRQLAAEAPRPFHLVAVGSGDRQREYARRIEERGLASLVTLLEFVPDIQPVLSQLDLLVVPSLWEACPLVPMEAMAAGVPVLGTDCIGLREVLAGSPSRMVRTGDVDDLHRGLADALVNPWTSQARTYAPAACVRFDNTRSARLLVELFGQTLSRRSARH